MKLGAPPLKSQGIKTKLVPWIEGIVPRDVRGRWIEPFMGTGAVALNIAPRSALLCDTNPHLIAFYKAIQRGELTAATVRRHLEGEGARLRERGEDHYYAIRDRFNASHAPLDFLFLNRAGFNGMLRYNRSGEFNIPFCRKPNRFTKAYVTKIANQVERAACLIAANDFEFRCQAFEKTIAAGTAEDVIYCDPPYIGRHADYYSGWTAQQEHRLSDMLGSSPSRFILSTWHHNRHRANEYIDSLWSSFEVTTAEHFYHVGGRLQHRAAMIEALITNYSIATSQDYVRISGKV